MATLPRRLVGWISGVAVAGTALALGAPTTGAVGDQAACNGIDSLGRVNNAPLAVDDEVWTAPGTEVAIDVLANDRDFDGDALAVVDVLPAGHGTARAEDGVVRYAPDPGFEGADAFTYRVGDGGCGTAPATVRIQVSTTPPPPDEATPEPPVVGVVTFTG